MSPAQPPRPAAARSAASPASTSGPGGRCRAAQAGRSAGSTSAGSARGRSPSPKGWRKRSSRRDSTQASTVRPARTAGSSPCATASKLVIPASGFAEASASPRAAASPMRSPVKVPGPTVAPYLWISAKPTPASASSSCTKGTSRSACPRAMGSARTARTRRSLPHQRAAAQALVAVSRPRVSMANS
nr:hypothetical protein [Indioceanicola profundi]